jgi:glycerophosphoryl diester phosphodiesterase
MLIIAHRGSSGDMPENTMQSFEAAYGASADMIEFDVRLTRDNKLVVIHDARLLRTHKKVVAVSGKTLAELRELTAATMPIPTLREVLDRYCGKVLINIELKGRGSGIAVAQLLKKHYMHKSADWDNVLISSFRGGELLRVRKACPHANLALLHDENPFMFIAYHKRLKLTAVGFHRLYINRLAVEIAKKAKIFIYVYTVNRTAAIEPLQRQGIDGIVTNYPDKFRDYMQSQQDTV